MSTARRLFGVALFSVAFAAPLGAWAEPNDSGLFCVRSARFWSKLRAGAVDGYCHHLRSMRALVWFDAPRAALHQARAEAIFPGARETKEQAALLLLAGGNAAEAHAAFEALTPRMRLHEGGAVYVELGRARAALASGHGERALSAYRPVVLALGEVGSPAERARVLFEASVAASYASPDRSLEAEAYLRASGRELSPLLEPLRRAMSMLQAVRAAPEGSRQPPLLARDDELGAQLAWIIAREKPAFGAPNEVLPVLPPGELDQLLGVVLFSSDPDGARVAFAKAATDTALPPHLRGAAAELAKTP